MAPIGTPSTSTEFGSPSATTIAAPQWTKGRRSPIRFPMPERQQNPTSSKLGWDSSNPNLHPNKTHIDFTQTTERSPHNAEATHQNTQSERMPTDHTPRRSRRHSTSDPPSHKRGAQTQSLPNNNKHQHQQQNKRHHAERDVDNFVAGMAKNMKQILVNAHHNESVSVHNRTGPIKKLSCRQHDSKGVSNFHLDQKDQVIRTHAGHPRCNYCFVASHPRTGCKFRKQDLRNGIEWAVHPEKGLLSYKDVQHQPTPTIPVATLKQLPNEILEQIYEYLTFKDRCRFGATNKRIQFILTADKFWHKISIPNHILKSS